MIAGSLDIVILGLSITSSWGNGHATTYRGLVRALSKKGHQVTFLERDVPWYSSSRDLPHPPFCKTILYTSLEELAGKYKGLIENANLLIVGSYVPEGVLVGELVTALAKGVTAFYDIDTPVTLSKIEKGDFEYLHPKLIPLYNLYLSFTGGETLQKLQEQYGSPGARAFYCSFDPELYFPDKAAIKWDLGYLGTFSEDRQPPLQNLMLNAAQKLTANKFVVAGSQYPDDIPWPGNVERIEHLPPADHRMFYCSQRYTMNITRADMIKAGYSPSVRLFEAAACGTPIISDYWKGIEDIFDIGSEILISYSMQDTRSYLTQITEAERKAIGKRLRNKVMNFHTADHRVTELETYYQEALIHKAIYPKEN